MSEKYDHSTIEKKWQQRWADSQTFTTQDKKDGAENFYFLTEFPYPSGNLHVGHWYAFSVPDIFVRYMRARGHNVMYPIGFDAFGLPAENAAIKNKLNPREWTFNNIEYMRGQLRSMGASFDWSREVITADPSYYKWTQWLFLKLYEKGLVYRKETAVNWCPKDKTVLANEQVVNGLCERCDTPVEQRLMPQWNIKITDYADRLIDDLKELDWPKQIKDAQTNWIGRSDGAEIDFALTNGSTLKIFTTRPDTLFGATYMVVAPEHALVKQFGDAQVQKYVADAGKKTELERTGSKEKTGVELKGVKATNPATKEEIPIWVADYVLGNYGTGAIMAVPAHDERDFEFAKKNGLPIREVIIPDAIDSGNPPKEGMPTVERKNIYGVLRNPKDNTILGIKWKHDGRTTLVIGGVEGNEDPVSTALREIREETGYTNIRFVRSLGEMYAGYHAAHKKENRRAHMIGLLFELVDESQTTIADEELQKHELVWIPESEVLKKTIGVEPPIFIPRLAGEQWTYFGVGTLTNSGQFDGLSSDEAKQKITEFVGGRMTKQYHLRDWVVSRQRFWGVPIPMIHCEKCGYNPVPEKDLPVVLPDLEDYLPTGEGKSPLAKKRDFVEVMCPKCGGAAERETDTLDTFVDSSWYFQRYADPHNDKEFASKKQLETWLPVDFYSGGSEHTTMHLLYSRFWHKAMYDMGLVQESEPYSKRMNRGLIMGPDGQKMSKSRGNVIDPDAVVAELGADTVRMYLAFIGPYNEVGSYPWNPQGAVGVRRFMDRVWRLKIDDVAPEVAMDEFVEQVTKSIETLKLNTGVAILMTALNTFEEAESIPKKSFEIFLKLLQPYAPHISSELALMHGLELSGWPSFDPSQKSKIAKIAVQVNGRVRATIELAADASEDEALTAGKKAVLKWLEAGVKKEVYVPGKVINLVVPDA